MSRIYRDDHVPLARVREHAFETLPVLYPEARIVEPRMIEVVGFHRGPRAQEHAPLRRVHRRLAVHSVGPPAQQHAQAIDLQPVQPFQAGADHPLVAPAHQPEGRRAIEEVMLPGAFPDEVPGIAGVHADRPAPPAGGGVKRPSVVFLGALPGVPDRVGVVARLRWHKADLEERAVGGVAKAVHIHALARAGQAERAGHQCVRKRVSGNRRTHPQAHLDEIVRRHRSGRLRERDFARRPGGVDRQERGCQNKTLHSCFPPFSETWKAARLRARCPIRYWAGDP